MHHHPQPEACNQSRSKTIHALLTTAVSLVFSSTTSLARAADCDPVLAAYAKAEATRRYALYAVDRLDAAPKGDPTIVTIGDFEYDPNLVRKSPINVVQVGFTKGSHDARHEIDSLKKRERNGKARCEPLGERRLGTIAAVGYRIRDTAPGLMSDVTAIDLWVDRATGLPAVHGVGSDGGFRWVYGDAVAVPQGAR